MEGPYLPEGSGGEQPPEATWTEADNRALEAYEARIRAFEGMLEQTGRKPKRRRKFHDYTTANCEEAWAQAT